MKLNERGHSKPAPSTTDHDIALPRKATRLMPKAAKRKAKAAYKNKKER